MSDLVDLTSIYQLEPMDLTTVPTLASSEDFVTMLEELEIDFGISHGDDVPLDEVRNCLDCIYY